MENREIINGLKYIKSWKCNGDAQMYEIISNAISALEKQEQIVDASCETCKYKNRSGNTYPCFGCFRASDQDDYYEPYTEEEA